MRDMGEFKEHSIIGEIDRYGQHRRVHVALQSRRFISLYRTAFLAVNFYFQ